MSNAPVTIVAKIKETTNEVLGEVPRAIVCVHTVDNVFFEWQIMRVGIFVITHANGENIKSNLQSIDASFDIDILEYNKNVTVQKLSNYACVVVDTRGGSYSSTSEVGSMLAVYSDLGFALVVCMSAHFISNQCVGGVFEEKYHPFVYGKSVHSGHGCFTASKHNIQHKIFDGVTKTIRTNTIIEISKVKPSAKLIANYDDSTVFLAEMKNPVNKVSCIIGVNMNAYSQSDGYSSDSDGALLLANCVRYAVECSKRGHTFRAKLLNNVIAKNYVDCTFICA